MSLSQNPTQVIHDLSEIERIVVEGTLRGPVCHAA